MRSRDCTSKNIRKMQEIKVIKIMKIGKILGAVTQMSTKNPKTFLPTKIAILTQRLTTKIHTMLAPLC